MKNITVVGTGYVGLIEGVCLADKGNFVTCFDLDDNKIQMLNSGRAPFYEKDLESYLQKNIAQKRLSFTSDSRIAFEKSEVIIIGVGTPNQDNGLPDISSVETAMSFIRSYLNNDCLIAIKSTVPSGTCEYLQKKYFGFPIRKLWVEVASNPEFLSQGTAIENAMKPMRIVFGTKSHRAERILREIYEPFHSPIVSVSIKSSEIIKYASNSFLALKISYVNELANLCGAIGADVKEVTEGMKLDPRIGSGFLNPGVGFGGSCLPKDSLAFSLNGRENQSPLLLIETAITINNSQNLILYYKAKEIFQTFLNKNVAILGLSFKPETDDIRGSVAIKNISLLIEEGAEVFVFDPKAMEAFSKTPLGKKVHFSKSEKDVLKNVDMAFIFTEWNIFSSLTANDFLTLMRTPFVFDGRNILDYETMHTDGVQYYSVGRKWPLKIIK